MPESEPTVPDPDESQSAAPDAVSLRLPRVEARTAIGRRTLHAHVTERLRDMIVEGELGQGERIDERALCTRFEVSRTPLREALKVLASEGLVELLPNRGARVTEITATDVEALFELAAGLERMAAELAAERATDRELAELGRLQDTMERHHEARRRAEYFRANQRIHSSIIAFARNDLLGEMHAGLMTKIRRARYQANASQDRWDASVHEHRGVLGALEARDAADAGRRMREHVLNTGAAVAEAVGGEDCGVA